MTVKRREDTVQSNRVRLVALLAGARNEKNPRLSQRVFNRMKENFPRSSDPMISASVLLANTYASAGNIDMASDIKIQLHQSGAKKKVGLTWTEVDGQLFVSQVSGIFSSKDMNRYSSMFF